MRYRRPRVLRRQQTAIPGQPHRRSVGACRTADPAGSARRSRLVRLTRESASSRLGAASLRRLDRLVQRSFRLARRIGNRRLLAKQNLGIDQRSFGASILRVLHEQNIRIEKRSVSRNFFPGQSLGWCRRRAQCMQQSFNQLHCSTGRHLRLDLNSPLFIGHCMKGQLNCMIQIARIRALNLTQVKRSVAFESHNIRLHV